MLYLKGKAKNGLLTDHHSRALHLLDVGCEGKDINCCSELSKMFLVGKDNCLKDMAKAFKYALKGCELGHIPSCINVSLMYRRGDGVKKNEELADEYKNRAQILKKEENDKVVHIEFQNT